MNQREAIQKMEEFFKNMIKTMGIKKTQDYAVNEVSIYFKDNPNADKISADAANQLIKILEQYDFAFRWLVLEKHKHAFYHSIHNAIGAVLVQWLKIKDYPNN